MIEYIVGSLTTLTAILIFIKFFKKEKAKAVVAIKFSQSSTYDMVKDFVPTNWQSTPLNTQASKYLQKNLVRIVFVKNSAYWIKENKLYVADTVNGEIVPDTTRGVDTYSMDDVQLKKIQFIVDKLTEGITDEGGYPGNKKF
jgi:hypothetical protein